MALSIIISTYNSPAWMEKVIWGYIAQSERDFELIVADDGSGEETQELLRRIKGECPFPLRHVWQEHKGFGKCAILNKAIVAAAGDYLIISDGDCVPREDFVKVHMDNRAQGRFISGGYCKLPMHTSIAIGRDDIFSQRAFDPRWLRENGARHLPFKLTARGAFARLLNTLTPTTPTWNGHNSSGWKKDIVAVNGFNEDMSYGGLDRELGERLVNHGLIPVQVRHLAICIHLDHARSYKDKAQIGKNIALRRETRKRGIDWAENGIIKGPRPQ